MAVAEWLEKHPNVDRVLFPGLKAHPQHEIAKRQMKGFGGMVTFYVKGDLAKTKKFLESVKLFSLAESLGGVESLVNYPPTMTHGSIPPDTRKALGITDNIVRLSVGIENLEDIKRDLDSALRR
jgi:cystathionine gamma-lyase